MAHIARRWYTCKNSSTL